MWLGCARKTDVIFYLMVQAHGLVHVCMLRGLLGDNWVSPYFRTVTPPYDLLFFVEGFSTLVSKKLEIANKLVRTGRTQPARQVGRDRMGRTDGSDGTGRMGLKNKLPVSSFLLFVCC